MAEQPKRLPDFGKVVVAHMVGKLTHSGENWHREGWAFMYRSPHEEYTGPDGWALESYNTALERIGADQAAVESWFYLSDIADLAARAEAAEKEVERLKEQIPHEGKVR
jgi:hypothetical protein